jgi:hypothetical protein
MHHSYDPCCSPVRVSIPLQNRVCGVPSRGHLCPLRAAGVPNPGRGCQVPIVTCRFQAAGGEAVIGRRRCKHFIAAGAAFDGPRWLPVVGADIARATSLPARVPMAGVTFVSSTSDTATSSKPDASLSATSPNVTENCDALPAACVLAWRDGAGPVRWWRCAHPAALANCIPRCGNRAAGDTRCRSGAGAGSRDIDRCALLKAAARKRCMHR